MKKAGKPKGADGPKGIDFPIASNEGPKGIDFPIASNEGPKGIDFPIASNVQAASLASQIQGVQPSVETRPVKNTYRDHMGDIVVKYEDGGAVRYSYDSSRIYGDYGHAFGMGHFIVNESGEMVFASKDPDQYNSLLEKCRPFWRILKGIRDKFPGYRIEMSRGERLAVNDKIIKGFLFYPGMVRRSKNADIQIQQTIEFVSGEIQRDIDSGRIVKGQYGTE